MSTCWAASTKASRSCRKRERKASCLSTLYLRGGVLPSWGMRVTRRHALRVLSVRGEEGGETTSARSNLWR